MKRTIPWCARAAALWFVFLALLPIPSSAAPAEGSSAAEKNAPTRVVEPPSSVVESLGIIPTTRSEAERMTIVGIRRFNEGKLDEARGLFSQAINLDPTRADAHMHLGIVLDMTDDTRGAMREYRATLEQNPVHAVAANNLAWILATDGDPQNRNGVEAVRLAEQACRVIGHKEPMFLATLAAAYAEVGRFKDAIKFAQDGLAIARAAKASDPTVRLEHSIECYELGLPFREFAGK